MDKEKCGKRKQQAAEMRARIQAKALDLFGRYGYENVSMEDIARAAECSVGNLYHYFPGKESIASLMTDYVDEEYEALAKKYEDAGDSMTAEEVLIDFCVESLVIDSKEELLYQCFIYSIRYPEQGVIKSDSNRAYFKLMREIAERFAAECELKEGVTVEDVVRAMAVLNRGLLIHWRIEEASFDIVEAGRLGAETLVRGLRK